MFMQNPTFSTIKLADYGSIDLSIPLMTYGAGRPILTLLTGIHGDETSGLFVIEYLLGRLPDFKGQLRVIPSANPVAQALQLRVSPRDDLDLNRIFPGKPDGQYPERIAYQLMKYLSDSDLVVDFHSFALRNPLIAIFPNFGERETRRQSLEYVQAFNPVMIWQLDFEKQPNQAYRGALAPALANAQVPNFAIEMPIVHRLTDEDIERAYQGMINVMARLGMVSGPAPEKGEIPTYQRQEYFSPRSGLFFPLKEIMTEVKKGETIGRIAGIKDFKNLTVKAPLDGMLIQIHERAFATTGSAIFAMGLEV